MKKIILWFFFFHICLCFPFYGWLNFGYSWSKVWGSFMLFVLFIVCEGFCDGLWLLIFLLFFYLFAFLFNTFPCFLILIKENRNLALKIRPHFQKSIFIHLLLNVSHVVNLGTCYNKRGTTKICWFVRMVQIRFYFLSTLFS